MSSIVDAFSKEDRIEVKISQFTEALKGASEKEILMNAIECEVPYRYIREMITGKSEKIEESKDSTISENQEETEDNN